MNGPQLAAEALRCLEASRKPTSGHSSGAAERNIARAQVLATLALAASTIDAAEATSTAYSDREGQDRVMHEPANAQEWRTVFAHDPEEVGTDG